MSSLISHHPLGEEGIGGHNPFQGEVMGLSQGHAGQPEALVLTPSLALCQMQGTAWASVGCLFLWLPLPLLPSSYTPP